MNIPKQQMIPLVLVTLAMTTGAASARVTCGDLYDDDHYETFCGGSDALANVLANFIMWLAPYVGWPLVVGGALISPIVLIGALIDLPRAIRDSEWKGNLSKAGWALFWGLICTLLAGSWFYSQPAHFIQIGGTSLIALGLIFVFVAIRINRMIRRPSGSRHSNRTERKIL